MRPVSCISLRNRGACTKQHNIIYNRLTHFLHIGAETTSSNVTDLSREQRLIMDANLLAEYMVADLPAQDSLLDADTGL